jgi:hypothetical protein
MDVVLNLAAMAGRFQPGNGFDLRFHEAVGKGHIGVLSRVMSILQRSV